MLFQIRIIFFLTRPTRQTTDSLSHHLLTLCCHSKQWTWIHWA